MDNQRSRSQPGNDGKRETIETIVIVAVLVLLLKMFIAEAFIIPTGSMATTLLGAHEMVKCPQCGYEFAVNCSSQRETLPGREPDQVVGCTCPNCHFRIDFHQEHEHPACGSGDRLVVGKFLYDLHLNAVAREDVVVFKYPQKPQEHAEAMNYIKRLVGEPGETLAIHQGNLYVYPGSGKDGEPPLTYAGYPRPDNPQDLWQKEYTYENAPEAIALFQQGKFQIVRKAPAKVLALRRLVYDNDYPAKDLAELNYPPRWAPEANGQTETLSTTDPFNYLRKRKQAEEERIWTADTEHGFRHAAQSSSLAWLRYRNLVVERGPERGPAATPPSEVKPQLITDFMGYDSWRSRWTLHTLPSPNWVGDLILECQVNLPPASGQAAQGQLVLELAQGVDRFQARWDLPSGQCTLVRLTGSKEEQLASNPTSLKLGGNHAVRFANVDERLVVWVDRSLPFGDGVAYPAPRESGPFANDLQPASIGVSGLALGVHHLRLWRDTYYTLSPGSGDSPLASEDWSDPAKWQPLRNLPVETFYVQPGHYLCLGDNSPESADSRMWGLVPNRLLLGRALVVYYPFRRVGPIQ